MEKQIEDVCNKNSVYVFTYFSHVYKFFTDFADLLESSTCEFGHLKTCTIHVLS